MSPVPMNSSSIFERSTKVNIRSFRVKKPKRLDRFLGHTLSKYLLPTIQRVHAMWETSLPTELQNGEENNNFLLQVAKQMHHTINNKCTVWFEQKFSFLCLIRGDPLAFFDIFDITFHKWRTLLLRDVYRKLDLGDPENDWEKYCLRKSYSKKGTSVHEVIIAQVLDYIDRYRWGCAVNKIKEVKDLGQYLTVYCDRDMLTNRFVERTHEFYLVFSNHVLSEQMTVSVYLSQAKKLHKDERHRVLTCLPCLNHTALNDISNAVRDRMISDHFRALLEDGFGAVFDVRRREDLKAAHDLLLYSGRRWYPGGPQEYMNNCFLPYVRQIAESILKDKEEGSEIVETFLTMMQYVRWIELNTFQGMQLLIEGLRYSFKSFVNGRGHMLAEHISKFIDGIVWRGGPRISKEYLESELDRTITLLSMIHDKEVFEACYTRDLSHRLLRIGSASIDHEKIVVEKLAPNFGLSFKNKMNGMIDDVSNSIYLMGRFQGSDFSQKSRETSVEYTVRVLRAGRWSMKTPLYKMKLPREIGLLHKSFQKFYSDARNWTSLSWHDVHGCCKVKARFPSGDKMLSLSLHQTVVLLLFNVTDKLSYAEISAATGIADEQLVCAVLSLACGEVQVLQKLPTGLEVNVADEFVFNKSLTYDGKRIKASCFQLEETEVRSIVSTEKVLFERKRRMEAALVRIMKSEKTMTDSLLFEKLRDQRSLQLNREEFEECVESLVHKDYLVRDEDDAQVLHYEALGHLKLVTLCEA